jgi:hypothetical protein
MNPKKPSKPRDKVIVYPEFESAFLGNLRRFGQTMPIAVYDYEKCLDILIKQGMDVVDAYEWLEINTLGGYLGEGTPVLLNKCSMEEFIEEAEINE